MRKILYVVTNVRISNGVTSVIMNHYDKLLNAGYTIDFCAMYNWGSPYVDKIKANGGHYYVLPQEEGISNEVVADDDHRNGVPDKKKSETFMNDIMSTNQYDIVHVHIIGKYALMALKIAKKNKVLYRVYHSHNPKYINNLYALLFTLYYDTQCVFYSNRYLACSSIAGKSMFGNRKFTIIKNTIDTIIIQFAAESRKRVRKELNIQNGDLLFGTVCRQTYQKNPKFIVDIFENIKKRVPTSKFIWIGSGEQEAEIKEYVKYRKLNKDIIFYGNKTNVEDYYSAMDAFVLPSKFEGLGIVLIEAQSCGVQVFASDVVPNDTRVTELIHYISLMKSAKEWAQEICDSIIKVDNREKYCLDVSEAGYDSNINNDLLEYYKLNCDS